MPRKLHSCHDVRNWQKVVNAFRIERHHKRRIVPGHPLITMRWWTGYVTESLHRAKRSLETSTNAAEWIDRHLVDVLTGETASDDHVLAGDLEPFLVKLLPALSRPMSPLPLDVVANGLAALSLRLGKPITFGAARRSLESYAVELPARARLSNGPD